MQKKPTYHERITCAIDKETLQNAENLAYCNDSTLSQIVRRALRDYIKKQINIDTKTNKKDTKNEY
jgi:hypothetical protein